MSENRLLLVAGPSGAGKSEFIRQIRDNTLPQSIMARLPSGCASWPVVEANNMLKDRLSEAQLMAEVDDGGPALLHYDVTYIHRFGMTDYARDPFASLLAKRNVIDVITIRPDIQRLTAQYRGRSEMHRQARSRPHRLWADWVRRPVKRAALKAQGLPALDAAELYSTPGFLDACYAAWDDFLRRFDPAASRVSLVEVAPAPDSMEHPSFVLLGAGQPANPRPARS
jgi:hypothetical protein